MSPGSAALVNSFGALGSFVGSWVVGWLQGYTGSSKAGYLLMSASVTLSGCLTLILRPPSSRNNNIELEQPIASSGTAR